MRRERPIAVVEELVFEALAARPAMHEEVLQLGEASQVHA
jgi:hypothetical protein